MSTKGKAVAVVTKKPIKPGKVPKRKGNGLQSLKKSKTKSSAKTSV